MKNPPFLNTASGTITLGYFVYGNLFGSLFLLLSYLVTGRSLPYHAEAIFLFPIMLIIGILFGAIALLVHLIIMLILDFLKTPYTGKVVSGAVLALILAILTVWIFIVPIDQKKFTNEGFIISGILSYSPAILIVSIILLRIRNGKKPFLKFIYADLPPWELPEIRQPGPTLFELQILQYFIAIILIVICFFGINIIEGYLPDLWEFIGIFIGCLLIGFPLLFIQLLLHSWIKNLSNDLRIQWKYASISTSVIGLLAGLLISELHKIPKTFELKGIIVVIRILVVPVIVTFSTYIVYIYTVRKVSKLQMNPSESALTSNTPEN